MKDDNRLISVSHTERGEDFFTLFFLCDKDMRQFGKRLYNLCLREQTDIDMKLQVKNFGHDDPNNPLHFHTDGDPAKRYGKGLTRHIHIRYNRPASKSDWKYLVNLCNNSKENLYINPAIFPRKVEKLYTTLAEIFAN